MKLINDFLDTFTNKPSRFSSKRAERFFVFASLLLATNVFLWQSILKCSIDATDLMIVCGGWLAYAGFNIVQGRKDKDNGTDK